VRAAPGREERDLLGAVHHELEVLLRRLGELCRVEHAFEQHDRRAHGGVAEREAFLGPRHGKRIRVRERKRGRYEPVAVSVGLDRDAGATRRTAARLSRSALESMTARTIGPREIE
jgi:hypothetical protein